MNRLVGISLEDYDEQGRAVMVLICGPWWRCLGPASTIRARDSPSPPWPELRQERKTRGPSQKGLGDEGKMVKLVFGSFRDSSTLRSVKAYLAEFIATLLFVFAGVGSAIAYGESRRLRCSRRRRCVVHSGLPTAW